MRNLSFEKLEFIANTLKTISHPIRLKVIEKLEDGKKYNVQEITQYLGDKIEQSLLSHHLIKMKDKGIIDSQKSGQFVYYQLKLKEVIKLLDCMENCKIN